MDNLQLVYLRNRTKDLPILNEGITRSLRPGVRLLGHGLQHSP
jgi:hypothetical protein